MDNTQDQLSSNEARQALVELDAANLMTEQALSDTAPPPKASEIEARVLAAVTDTNVDFLRNKAKRQRQRGVENLTRRHDGVASVVRAVALRERVVGSAFERYFATIETGIHVIARRGALFIGDANAEKIMGTIVSMIAEMETRIDAEISRATISLEVHTAREDFITPSYTNPAAEHEVQLRTPLANRVLNVFKKQDEYVVMLNKLLWNDEAEADSIDQEEYQIKKEMRALAQFIARTLRGMQNRAKPAAAKVADGAAPAANADSTAQPEAA